jgi:hypothetical protein
LELALCENNSKLAQTIGGLFSNTLSIVEKQLTNLMQNILFINQIILLNKQLTKVLEDLSQDLKHFFFNLFAPCL